MRRCGHRLRDGSIFKGQFACFAGVIFLAAAALAQPAMRFSLKPEVLDLTNCLAQPGNVPLALPGGSGNLEIIDWSAAAAPTNYTGEFLLRFKTPTPVGSVIAYDAGEISFATNNVWQSLPAGAEEGRTLQIIPFPPGVAINAIRFNVHAHASKATNFRAVLPFATLVPIRTVNIAKDATVTVDSAVGTNQPIALIDGRVNARRNFSTAPRPSPAAAGEPAWIMLSWPQTVSFRGLAFFRGDTESGPGRIEFFSGDGDPRSPNAPAAAWQQIVGRSTAPGLFRANQFLVSFQPIETRGLRVTSTGEVARLSLGEIAVLRDLGTAPAPAPPRKLQTNTWLVPKVAAWRITIDGRDDDWPKERHNNCALAFDEDRLYLLHQARGEAAAFDNTGTNLTQLFSTGDAVDVQLQTRAGLDPNRTSPDLGDIRLLFSLSNGQPVCVLYDYRVEDLLVLAATFNAAGHTVSCDRVTLIPDAKVELRRGPDAVTLEASVPLKAIHLDPKSLIETRGDVVRIVRPSGVKGPAVRQSWADPAAAPFNDIASGAEISPARWGVIRFEAK